MKRLLRRAAVLGEEGEVPVSAVILDEAGRCIGHGRNTRERDHDPMGHAELVALRQASSLRGDWRFNDCTLIVTLEPCTMCAATLVQARMGRVVYGAHDPKRGGLGGTIDLANHPSAHHHMVVVAGVMEDKARVQLETWFRQRRRRNR
ncbi:MAG: nucleoside deaminase [Synechococcus sp.]